MAGNTAPLQEDRPRILTTSFEPVVVALPPFLQKRIPVLSGPIEALERTDFVPLDGSGNLPPGVESFDGMPKIELGDYDQARSVKGIAVVKGGVDTVDADAKAITFRNSQNLAERAFAITHDPDTGEETFMDRKIEEAVLHGPVSAEAIDAYREAMAMIGPLATSGCPTDPPDDNNIPAALRVQGLSIVPPVQGEHDGGFRYGNAASNTQVVYLDKDNFNTPNGGAGRHFDIQITNDSVPLAELQGATALYFTPPPAPGD